MAKPLTSDSETPYYGSAARLVPETEDLEKVSAAAKQCKACHLWRHATQTVFGLGSKRPLIMLVGEQPGDKEDIEGRPFVGPAGRVLDEALAQAGIDPTVVYTTNAVKHFKWEAGGKRRIHKKPNRAEMGACRPWLEAEIRLLQPYAIVLLGATAAQSLLGAEFKLTQHRGERIASTLAPIVTATVHPSSLLRIPDHDRRVEERARFVEDLRRVATWVEPLRKKASA